MPVLKNVKHELSAQEIAKGATLERAYVLAGYKPDAKNADRLTKKDGVRARIDEIVTRAAKKTDITVERVLDELAKIAYSDIRKAVQWGAGVLVKDSKTGKECVVHDVSLIGSAEIDDRTAAAISEVRRTKSGLSIKFHDKQAALVN